MHQDDVSGLRRGLRSGGGAPEESPCRPGSYHAYECASIHWIPRLKIVLAFHRGFPLHKVGLATGRVFELAIKNTCCRNAGNKGQCSQDALVPKTQLFARGRSRIYILNEEADCYATSWGRDSAKSSDRPSRLFQLRICDWHDGSDMPALCIANERLADQKLVVLRWLAWKASRENDGHKNLHNVV